MKKLSFLFLILFPLIFTGCGGSTKESRSPSQAANNEPKKIEDGYYSGKGVVTKINPELGSVEIDHEEIVGLMPAMKMEFSVRDKRALNGIAVGDSVVFTVEYKEGKETIITIGK